MGLPEKCSDLRTPYGGMNLKLSVPHSRTRNSFGRGDKIAEFQSDEVESSTRHFDHITDSLQQNRYVFKSERVLRLCISCRIRFFSFNRVRPRYGLRHDSCLYGYDSEYPVVTFLGTSFGPSLNLPFFLQLADSVFGAKHDDPAHSCRRR
jgi:hypothetical protein